MHYSWEPHMRLLNVAQSLADKAAQWQDIAIHCFWRSDRRRALEEAGECRLLAQQVRDLQSRIHDKIIALESDLKRAQEWNHAAAVAETEDGA